jgi:acyl-lipid omega-6 desaturase (Delta-12 desaturase)
VCFAALWVLMYRAMAWSYGVTLLLSIPTSGFLLRLFLIQHDCGHGSFVPARAANEAIGFALGILTLTPYHQWRRNHSLHHAAACDLDRRGHGDIRVLTLSEYLGLSPLRRFSYRVFRHPICLFVVAPLFHFAILQRFPYYTSWSWKKSAAEDARGWRVEQRGVHATNAAIAVVMLLAVYFLGFRTLVAVHLPVTWLAGCAGMGLFHVQHTFGEARWVRHADWDYVTASMRGSTYLRLPRALQWITANIGLHHVHHLDSRIPNYRLPQCLVEMPELHAVPTITLVEGLRCVSLSLWDDRSARFVRFRDLGNRRDRVAQVPANLDSLTPDR